MNSACITQAAFSVSDVSEIIEVSEDALRGWLARNVTSYSGQKAGHRLWFTGRDIYFFSILRDLAAFGVSIRIAMYTAERLVDEAGERGPLRDEVLVVRLDDDKTSFVRISRYEIGEVEDACLYLPLASIWSRIMERASAKYATEAN
ncbi:hypothetical protein HF206_06505 [Rhizobium leguminosarum]|nr:hypothetical protein [Rhizobium leguminosarum]MBY2913774.1 hypothetical protein [Rhizobium leguminosarum]MBY2969311.1 hypothetical protein [Rhizobium leguminosarum]MBY3005235.1 hypothetical protein [Rhizobium leguminosarum]